MADKYKIFDISHVEEFQDSITQSLMITALVVIFGTVAAAFVFDFRSDPSFYGSVVPLGIWTAWGFVKALSFGLFPNAIDRLGWVDMYKVNGPRWEQVRGVFVYFGMRTFWGLAIAGMGAGLGILFGFMLLVSLAGVIAYRAMTWALMSLFPEPLNGD